MNDVIKDIYYSRIIKSAMACFIGGGGYDPIRDGKWLQNNLYMFNNKYFISK